MQTKVISTKEPSAISQAHQVLERGGIIAFPTDTVYGVAAGIFSIEGIDALYRAKERDPEKAIPVLMSSFADLEQVAENVSQVACQLGQEFWPGPLTLIVPRHPSLPKILGPFPTLGVRVPDHSDARALMQVTGPLAVTSANLSGAPDACSAQGVLDQLEGRIDLILDGGITPGGKPSTVVDCTTPELRVLRQGPIALDELRKNF
jgi:L-threonylcarbamoyladenylate synthase